MGFRRTNQKRKLPLTKWSIENSPEITKKIERNLEGDFIFYNERLASGDAKIHLPYGLALYDTVGRYRLKSHLLFVAEEDNFFSRIYASIVGCNNFSISPKYGLNLLNLPWFNHTDSEKIFNRLLLTYGNAVLKETTPRENYHPFTNYS